MKVHVLVVAGIAALAAFAIPVFTRPSTAVPGGSAVSGVTTNTGFRPGDIAPDFTLHSLDGQTVHLSDFRDHVVVLNFWATWCRPCRVEMPWLVAFDRQYRAQGMRIIGVNLDDTGTSRDTIAGFARERGVAYPILLGNSSVADNYGGVRFMPQTFVIARDGKILSSTYGITTREEFEANIKGPLTTIRR
jgi:peroxiredoxin